MLVLVHCFKNKAKYGAMGLAVHSLVINVELIANSGRAADIMQQGRSQMVLLVVRLAICHNGHELGFVFFQNDSSQISAIKTAKLKKILINDSTRHIFNGDRCTIFVIQLFWFIPHGCIGILYRIIVFFFSRDIAVTDTRNNGGLVVCLSNQKEGSTSEMRNLFVVCLS